MDNFAPVLIPTLNRHDHFKRCIESLSACKYANKTDLIIALDYPLKETHKYGYKKIEAYIDKIHGFKSITIIRRSINLGAIKNFHDSLAEVFERYDRIIFSEDDNVFAPSFLQLINNGLSVYENRSDIFSISGYNMPIPMPSWYKEDVYLAISFVAWGVGIWRDKWMKVHWTLEHFTAMLNNEKNYEILKKSYQRYLPQLIATRDTGNLIADGVLFLYLLDKNMYSAYPVKSRVRNTGHDGSGDKIYLNQKIYGGLEDIYFPSDLQPNKKLLDLIINHMQPPIIFRLRAMLPARLKIFLRKILKKE